MCQSCYINEARKGKAESDPEFKKARQQKQLAYYYENKQRILEDRRLRYKEDISFREYTKVKRRAAYYLQKDDPSFREKKAIDEKKRYYVNPGVRRGISKEDWDNLVKDKCKICKHVFKEHREKHFDHDHAHCKYGCLTCFRGFLCGRCNLLIGHAKDSIDTLEHAINYLKEWKSKTT